MRLPHAGPRLLRSGADFAGRLDAFIYEPVFVGSFEDAFCATLLNPDLAAVVIHEGFSFRSRHDAPILRTLTEAMDQRESAEVSALRLAQVLKRVRPELDLYLVSNGHVEDIAGDPQGECGAPRVLCSRGAARAAPCNP